MIAHRCVWVVVLAAFVQLTPARGQDTAKDVDKIPKKVMEALKAKFPKAAIHKWTMEKEGDVVVYDIEFKEGDRKCEADIKVDGTYINYEREVAAKDLPKAVTDAVEKKYPKAKMMEIMEIMEVKGNEDKLEGYEIVLQTGDNKEVEVTIAPDGKILEDSTDPPKKEEKK
jgi:uncharacterized membrane protein YkoI